LVEDKMVDNRQPNCTFVFVPKVVHIS